MLDDEDEVLAELGDALGGLVDSLGGSQYAYLLLTPLEKMCYAEDSIVRDKVELLELDIIRADCSSC